MTTQLTDQAVITPKGISSNQRALLNHELDGDLDQIVAGERALGTSWRAIATTLTARTGRYVSHEALRSWYRARR